jgi:hypothetical protein
VDIAVSYRKLKLVLRIWASAASCKADSDTLGIERRGFPVTALNVICDAIASSPFRLLPCSPLIKVFAKIGQFQVCSTRKTFQYTVRGRCRRKSWPLPEEARKSQDVHLKYQIFRGMATGHEPGK